ncbi:tRNA1(Val) (adenine(37)-N6)-methyltransferase [Aerococcaceae bacterium NML180378]|nr:tRNA1(Val) (adenine(37)-N6)-methyltransferase [Aerococcaceae bacterium NML171108]MCW6676010.1 tRNA1(Val) (adenine(37)-N6)-methyltransferase [Aerococcaceae bacterium NML180378]
MEPDVLMNQLVQADERVDAFIRENLQIIQSPHYFSFSVDAILLAEFANVPRRASGRIMDFCSGNGVIPILLSKRTQANIDAVEYQAPLVDMAKRSAQLNGLETRLNFIQADLNELPRPQQLYDLITCNPPYFSVQNKQSQHHLTSHAIARHEVFLTLEQWVHKARIFLKDKGKLCCVYRPDRLDDLMEMLLRHGFSVNRMRFAYPKAHLPAKVVLIEAIYRGGRQGVVIEPPITIYQADNTYTPEMQAIYYGN